MITPVIMAGGSGSRLWPLSRSLYPKQFLALNGHVTMLQQTLERLSGLIVERPVVICNEEHRFIVAEQLREINKPGAIVLEPVGRNTAPAIALAAKIVIDSKDSLILILAADHIIKNEAAFVDAVEKAIPLAEAGKLVTFGIVPTEAHIGYGYIKRGVAVDDGYQVDAFVEKPSADTASEYLAGKEHYWNSGMFLM
jgi:mannose-1-phosphate guanylyltransferase